MQTFPSTDLKQSLGDVLHAANGGPVAITRHSKPRYVLMSIEHYEARFVGDERSHHRTTEMPDEHLELLETIDLPNPEDTGQ